MARISLLAILIGLILILSVPSLAQFDPQYDQGQTIIRDTTKFVPDTTDVMAADSDSVKVDSAKTDTLNGEAVEPVEQENVLPSNAGQSGEDALYNEAFTWLKRLLFRGSFDARNIGAYARYQLTAWNEALGSNGPILGRIGIYYLGSSEWMGRDAEWLQAVYDAAGQEPSRVEFDLIVPTASPIREIYRIIYRIDEGEMKTTSLPAAKQEELDYESADRPESEGPDDIKLYSGTYETEKFRGVGANGAVVVINRSKTVPPLGIVRLGYGDFGLTLIDKGLDAAARFDVPPPPIVRPR
jgi:hypothetical protein